MPIPVNLARQVLEHALDTPAEAEARTHVRVGPGGVPDVLFRDLRHLTETEWVTVWHSPRYRALLLAAQGAGELVFYTREPDYQQAVRDAQQGRLPPLAVPARDHGR